VDGVPGRATKRKLSGTWTLIRTLFGIHKADPRLVALGITGVRTSILMLARVARTQRHREERRAAWAMLDRTG
jgi:hypothetical protein